jgi:hypothetical protein
VARTIHTHLLGERVAPKWRLERIIRWAPTVAADRLIRHAVRTHRGLNYIDGRTEVEGESATVPEEEGWVDVRKLGGGIVKSVGMHKVHGDIVQGIMGGIFHQFVRHLLPIARHTC